MWKEGIFTIIVLVMSVPPNERDEMRDGREVEGGGGGRKEAEEEEERE